MSIESAGALVPDPLIADPTITESASALDPDPLIIEPIIIESVVPDVIRFYFFFIIYILLFYLYFIIYFFLFLFFYFYFFFLLLISYYISFFIIILLLFLFLTINFIISYKINFKKSKLFCIYNSMYRQLNYHSNVSSLFYKYTYNQRPK